MKKDQLNGNLLGSPSELSDRSPNLNHCGVRYVNNPNPAFRRRGEEPKGEA